MKNKIFTFLLFLLAFNAHAQDLRQLCISHFGEIVRCIDYGVDVRLYDLRPLMNPSDYVPNNTRSTSELQVNGSPKAGKSNIVPRETKSSDFGEGMAYGLAAFFQNFQPLIYDAELVKYNFQAVKSRVNDLNEKDREETKRAMNSRPQLFEANKRLRADISAKLSAHKDHLDRLDNQLDNLCEKNMNCKSGEDTSSNDDFSQAQLDYKIRDNVLTQKREELLRSRDSSKLSPTVVDNIYNASGLLQNNANKAFENEDIETAETAQSLATTMVDFGLDLVPIVSEGKGLYEAIFGINPITGEELSTVERTISGVSSIIGVASLGTLGAASKTALKSALLLDKFSGAKQAFQGAAKSLNAMSSIGISKFKTAREFVSSSIGRTWLTRVNADHVLTDQGHKLFDNKLSLSNALPEDGVFAKVIEKKYFEDIKNGKGVLALDQWDEVKKTWVKEAFITSPEDLRNVKGYEDMAKKLALYTDRAGTNLKELSDEFVIMTFRFKDDFAQSIRSPIETAWDARGRGFVPGGRTAGGAREWLIDNQAARNGLIDLDSINVMDIPK